ncbi:Beta-fructofuranosidase, insoluble isoenzyme CWINV1 [Vitis vinifera]|uniref:Beta-fructofuranosidase, insoluble isoenzyme CWINV1 n=1 Tax=Vitis vinifera TaxID=29760 RepID=A0A438EVZ9_VITVI|nr:Beta-fructofuranosidase, insoluble isoenzyme CWINV1 [Vitis vinifera]
MATSSHCLLWFFFSLFFGHGFVPLEASHQVYIHLQNQSPSSLKTHQPYRTGYHFQPRKNWMNDPNGPMIYKGLYHFFYQYNPHGAVWGNIVWAHSTSTDLVNWTPHKYAISPSQPADINGCWSGSATILPNGKPVILYTGIDPQNKQVQNMAVPKNLSDPFLLEWTKLPQNPLMEPTTINSINASSFRDPTTAWQGTDGRWRVIIGSKIKRKGLAILYRSKDFVRWTKAQHPLHSGKNTGMWECPDFFPVSINSSTGVDTSSISKTLKYVLKLSLDDTKHDYYTIGSYNREKDTYVPDKGILWGWINESSSVEHDIEKGWSGVQAIPRNVWLDKSGKQLLQWPIAEIEKQRIKPGHMSSRELKGGSKVEVGGITASQADVEISFKISDFKKAEVFDESWSNPQLLCSQRGASVKGGLGPFGLMVLASKGMEEYTAVFFRIFKRQTKYVVLMCSDQSRSSLDNDNDKTTYGAFLDVDPVHEKLSLRSLIDHSIVESFGGGGKVCITARVYPTLAIDGEAHLYAFNKGTGSVGMTTLRAWSMKKAKIN